MRTYPFHCAIVSTPAYAFRMPVRQDLAKAVGDAWAWLRPGTKVKVVGLLTKDARQYYETDRKLVVGFTVE